MTTRVEVPLPSVEISGFDAGLSDEELTVQKNLRRFASEVMRPIGEQLDKMPVEQAYQPGSPLWDFHKEAQNLGMDPHSLGELPPEVALSIEGIAVHEMGWGDAGLTVSAGAAGQPIMIAMEAQNKELIEMCQGKIGCWMITQPDRGSDGTILYTPQRFPGAKGNKGNLQAHFKGDDIIINGQSSAWVSNGPIAQVALLDIVADYGDGFYDKQGNTFGCNIILPLDLPGITRGKPLEKMGKRPLPQGETYFDNVKVPKRFAIATRDDYELKSAMAWARAGSHMGYMAAGLGRAAFELTLAYVHERKQGGATLADLQLTQYRLGGIAMKLEAMKAMARHVGFHTRCAQQPHPYHTASGKVFTCNELSLVMRECMSLFGGNGLTAEYPIEKMFRDAQAMQIEDGENNVLQLHYGHLVSRLYREQGWGSR